MRVRAPAAPQRPAVPGRRRARIRVGVHRPAAGHPGPLAHRFDPRGPRRDLPGQVLHDRQSARSGRCWPNADSPSRNDQACACAPRRACAPAPGPKTSHRAPAAPKPRSAGRRPDAPDGPPSSPVCASRTRSRPPPPAAARDAPCGAGRRCGPDARPDRDARRGYRWAVPALPRVRAGVCESPASRQPHAPGGRVLLVRPVRRSASDFTIRSVSRRISALNGPTSSQ